MGELTSSDIMTMDTIQLTDAVKHTYDIVDDVERAQLQAVIMIRAERLGAKTLLAGMIKSCEKSMDKMNAEFLKSDKKPAVTIANFLKVMRSDSMYDGIKYNLITDSAEVHRDGKILRWTDVDDAVSRNYIEQNYGIFSESKHSDALRMLFREREYNPIKDIVDCIEWDGKQRCEHFLTEWAKADDTAYTREVSRLIFAGGINRLYVPGCKFDDVPVLIGTKQGEGKSSLVRWLAINDDYFTDNITEMDGARSVEQLDGAWICEVAELLALTKQKEQEAAKAYITRQIDRYRRPYDRQIGDRPRRCIFIGTTNNRQFLRDKTGNRRYYPVEVHSNGYWLHDHEQECREYIMQCWAEARERFKAGKMPNYANMDLLDDYRTAQEEATEDDWRVGVIEKYLDELHCGEYVCVKQIIDDALSTEASAIKLTKKETIEIGQIVDKVDGWNRVGLIYTEKYGRQRCWKKRPSVGISEIPF